MYMGKRLENDLKTTWNRLENGWKRL